MTWELIVGPPGTGKTTTLLELLASKLSDGYTPEDIAYVSFTRAARTEVRKRLADRYGASKDDYPWVRTIHSMAMKLVGIKPGQLMDTKHWDLFAKETGFNFTPPDGQPTDGDDVVVPTTVGGDDDIARTAFEWGRSRMLGLEQTLRDFPGQLNRPRLLEYAEVIRAYKERELRYEFMDMLELALDADSRPPVPVAFIDEAQDLSPIQQQLAEKWFGDCETVYVAGDDDQAIYEFQGADPHWMLGLAERSDVGTRILTKSYRVPSKILEFSRFVIRRNRQRIDKEYEPNRDGGSIKKALMEDALRAACGSIFVLARNKAYLADPAQILFDRRVPYVSERWAPKMRNPYGSEQNIEAFRGCLALAHDGAISAGRLYSVLQKIPSIDRREGEKIRLLPHGVKTKVKGIRGGLMLTMSDLFDLDLHELVDCTAGGDPFALLRRISPRVRDYFFALANAYGKIPEPEIVLTTIHGSKGREADTVILLSDMAKASFREYQSGGQKGFESENRVAYVGMTRTRDRLVIAEPLTGRYYDYPVGR